MKNSRVSGRTVIIITLIVVVLAAVLGWTFRPKGSADYTQAPLASTTVPTVQTTPLKNTSSPSPSLTPSVPTPSVSITTPPAVPTTTVAPTTAPPSPSPSVSPPPATTSTPKPTTTAPPPPPSPTPTPSPSPSLKTVTINLSKWTAEAYPPMPDQYYGPAWWLISADGKSVDETRNSQPTFFLSDFQAMNVALHLRITAKSMAELDDDYFGFALGIQPGDTANHSADFLLVDWKNSIPGEDLFKDFVAPGPGGSAKVGLAVSRVQGVPTSDQFWQHIVGPNNEGVKELARGSKSGSIGWSFDQEYDFSFVFDASSLKVYLNGALEMSISGTFKDGRVALYEFSQEGVSFTPVG